MSSYNQEQIEALVMVRRFIAVLTPDRKQALLESMAAYLAFREEVDRFLAEHISDICNRKCYQSQISACCSKEGIVTFFADVAVNALSSSAEDLDRIEAALTSPNVRDKCVYLGNEGCLWRITPIVCAMFLCDRAQKAAFSKSPRAEQRWNELKNRRKHFTWPDRPVLFDLLEQVFIDTGFQSPLMYLHNSPGMLRVKRQAQK